MASLLRSSPLPATRVGCLTVAIISCFVGGSLYLFGIWSGQVKQLLGLSQTQANIIATFLFFGGCVATPLMNAVFHACHHQPWFLTLLLGLTAAGGYFIFYVAAKGLITSSLTWLALAFGSCLIGNNIMSLFVLALSASLTHLEPTSKQLFQTIAQAFYAIGNIVWPLVAKAIYSRSPDLASYLATLFLVLAICTLLVAAICIIFLVPVPREAETVPLNAPTASRSSASLKTSDMFRRLVTAEFLGSCLLYLSAFGLTANVLSNGSSMIDAFEISSSVDIFLLIVFFGVAQAIGRAICIGWNSAHLKAPQPYAPLCLAFLILSVGFVIPIVITGALPARACFLLAGVGYGIVWSSFAGVFMKLAMLSATTQAEEQDLLSFSIAISYAIAPAFGPLCAGLVSGWIYDAYGTAPATRSDIVCTGAQCYQLTYCWSLGLAAAGLVGAALLQWHDRRRRLPHFGGEIDSVSED